MGWNLKKCCCLPLRTGLLIWGYLALGISYLSTLSTLFNIQDALDGTANFVHTEYIGMTLFCGAQMVHFIFHIVLIGGLHKRSRGMLEVYYGYTVILTIIQVVIVFLALPLVIHKLLQTNTSLGYVSFLILITLAFNAIIVGLQAFVIVAVRSMISSIEDDKEDSVSQHLAADRECVPLSVIIEEDC